jgi:LemA protein
MKSRNLTWIIIIAAILLLGGCGCSGYNSMVKLDENVKAKWANVQSDYQRRSDLIPNLVNTVKGAANFEQTTLTRVVEARAKATQTTINPADLTPENIQRFQQAQGELSGALSRLLVTVERYPELKANQNFLNLQTQLEGTENRIKVSRNDFNTSVQDYNQVVRRFPNILFAGVMGFPVRQPFQADAGAQNAPSVNFNTDSAR